MTRSLYKVEFAPRTEDQLKKIPKNIRKQVMDRIEKLETNPRPVGIEPLQGAEVGLFRIRQGDYRIVYSIQDKKLLVLVVRVVHRNRSIRRNIRSERAEYACIYSSQAYLYARATSNA